MSPLSVLPEEAGRPPEPPEVGRRARFYPYQAVFVAVLVLLVALALLGAFGNAQATVRSVGTGLEMDVEYPARFRYKEVAPLRVTVHNASGQALDTVRVRFDEAYVEAFSNVTFTPSPEGVWEVILTDVGPGDRRVVSGEVQAERYGRHEGAVTVMAPGLRPVAVDVATFTFP